MHRCPWMRQDGNTRKSFQSANKAAIRLADNDTYIRTVIFSGNTTILLNPVIRYDGSAPVRKSSEIIWSLTLLKWLGYLILITLVLILIRARRKKRSKLQSDADR